MQEIYRGARAAHGGGVPRSGDGGGQDLVRAQLGGAELRPHPGVQAPLPQDRHGQYSTVQYNTGCTAVSLF